MLVRDDKVEMIHLSEINTIVVDSTMVSITSYLLVELMKMKIKILFCDQERNPIGEMVPYYGRHNSSKSIGTQIQWNEVYKKVVWTLVIKQKIRNQALHLEKLEKNTSNKLYDYYEQVTLFDETNREGHAAKVYFNSLFGKGFSREQENDINAALNYGYSILLSNFNKEIVSNGYLTQVGLKHCNEYNDFNLSSDLMEPFRILVDEIVLENVDERFNASYKLKLVDILNKQVSIDGQKQYLTNAIQIYLKSVFKALLTGDYTELIFFDFE